MFYWQEKAQNYKIGIYLLFGIYLWNLQVLWLLCERSVLRVYLLFMLIP